MIVIVDANVIVSNPLLRGAAWDQLRRAIEAGRTSVKLPRLAFDEAVAAYQRLRETKKIEITAVKRTSSRAVSDLLTQAIGVLDAETRTYPDILKRELEAAGVEIVRAPRISHSKLVAMATARRRPFDDKGGGYRDALHWATVLDVVREYADYEDIVFISNDRRAFGANAKSNDLHPHLVEDLAALEAVPWFRWLRGLSELPVPGIYEDELRWGVDVTAGELAGLVKTALWERSPVELLPRENGLVRDPVAITVLDIGEPDVTDIEIRQYFDEARFRTDFTVLLAFEIAAWYYADMSDDGVVEERATLHYAADAHADFVVSAGDDYSFSNLEFGQLTFIPIEEPPAVTHPATYAIGPVRRSPYSQSAEVRSRE